ncbi:DUF4262 domain-containing protein [Phenylobacterium sp. LjRoot225]|uniref:DUF4262 domain-containing protein n=1 Tax=Phenylobacterium sp. LjRoot225 TaxID=3342285 RepID=UPI003ECF27BC
MTPPELMFFCNGRRPSLRERLWLSGQMRKVARHVKASGWTAIPFQLPHDAAPRFFYTVGFDETLNQPELIAFDQTVEVAVNQFHVAFQELQAGELALEDGMVWAQDGPCRCVLRKVHPGQLANGWVGLARERRRIVKGDADGLQAFQLVATDRSGFLPWEPGYDEAVRKWQPALYEPPDDPRPDSVPA